MIAAIAENKKKANVLDFFFSIFWTHIEFICYVSPVVDLNVLILVIFAKFITQTVIYFCIPSMKSTVSADELRSKAISNYKLTRKILNRSNAGLFREARECQMSSDA